MLAGLKSTFEQIIAIDGTITLMKYGNSKDIGIFRRMTLTEIKSYRGSHCWVVSISGSAVRVKINGRIRTWKRDANRIEVPIKYGLYEYGTLSAAEALDTMLIEVS